MIGTALLLQHYDLQEERLSSRIVLGMLDELHLVLTERLAKKKRSNDVKQGFVSLIQKIHKMQNANELYTSDKELTFYSVNNIINKLWKKNKSKFVRSYPVIQRKYICLTASDNRMVQLG